jgi:hypothetical protein
MQKYTARLLIVLPALFAASAAQAYIGPGAGLSAVGSALALLGAVLLMIVGFVWYPIKRLMKRKKAAPESASSADSPETKQQADRRTPPVADRKRSRSPPDPAMRDS